MSPFRYDEEAHKARTEMEVSEMIYGDLWADPSFLGAPPEEKTRRYRQRMEAWFAAEELLQELDNDPPATTT